MSNKVENVENRLKAGFSMTKSSSKTVVIASTESDWMSQAELSLNNKFNLKLIDGHRLPRCVKTAHLSVDSRSDTVLGGFVVITITEILA